MEIVKSFTVEHEKCQTALYSVENEPVNAFYSFIKTTQSLGHAYSCYV